MLKPSLPCVQILASIVVWLCCCLSTCTSAAEAVYSNIEAGRHFKQWMLLGPIVAAEDGASSGSDDAMTTGLDRDWLESAGGEAAVDPQSGQALKVQDDELTWQPHRAAHDIIDLATVLGPKDSAVAYAAATIESSDGQPRLAGLGSDDGVRVWLNGVLVHKNNARRATATDDDVFQLKLQQGTNRLLIKVANDRGDWSFAFRLLSPESLISRLFKAAAAGDAELVEKLVSWGVDVNVRSPFGLTAIQIAKMRGHDHVAEFLTGKGAAAAEPFDPTVVVPALLAEIAANDAPGVAVLVARDGKVLLSLGRGMADLAHNVPITSATKFRIGSISKQFTAAAILKLQEEGRLSVNDKLTKFFPDYPRGDEVAINHLLTHTSGIKSYTSKPDFLKSVGSMTTSDSLIESFRDDPFDFDPGAQFSYNNSGYFLLGVIIEKVSGKSYGDYLRETFFEPLGMRDTGVHTATEVIKHEATGYGFEGSQVKKALDWDMSHAGGAGSLYSTVEDLMRWNEGVFGGTVLSKGSLEAAFTPVKLDSGEAPAMQYGYGWIMGEERGLKTISHGGGLHGWMSLLTRYVDQNTTVVVLHNALPPMPGFSPEEVSSLIADAFLWQDMSPRPKYEVDELVDAKTLAQYVGRYDYRGAVMDIALESDQLTAQLTGQRRHPIFPMGDDQFFWKVVDARVEFIKDDSGKVVSVRHTQGNQTFVAKRLPDEDIVQVDEETLDRYVGKYAYPGIGVLTVRRDGGRLLAQLSGQPEFEIYPKAADTFFWKVVAAEIKFVTGDNGKIEKAIHDQAGATIEAKRVE